jgi:sterol 24-C-methyltransferase
VNDPNETGQPWHLPLIPSYNIFSQRFQFTPLGMTIVNNLLYVLENLRLAPTGTSKVRVATL